MSEQELPQKSLDEWRALAEKELKGDLDRLTWHTPEGLDVAPLYTAADLEGLEAVDTLPGFEPFLRGVRATMYTNRPWTIRQYAGFSTADPQRMHLPLVADPVYGYQVTNVESQMRNTNSLLNWTRTMISVRRQHPTFGMGSFTEVGSRNPTVLSFVREFGDDKVFCVNNLSRFPQPVELDLQRFEGCVPVELTGGVHFPPIGELPYLLSLPGHGFLWFAVRGEDAL